MYLVEINGQQIELPVYSLEIAEKFERVEVENAKANGIREKLKNMYRAIEEIIGKEQAKKSIGEFAKADLNDINILYFRIINAYNKPLEDYQTESAKEKMDNANISELVDLFTAMSKTDLSKFGKTEKGGVPYRVK